MKKLLLLFIPLVLFFGCEPDDDNSNLTYNCIDDDCFAEDGGQYATLDDCLSVCDNNSTLRYNCSPVSGCFQIEATFGEYDSLEECEDVCSQCNCGDVVDIDYYPAFAGNIVFDAITGDFVVVGDHPGYSITAVQMNCSGEMISICNELEMGELFCFDYVGDCYFAECTWGPMTYFDVAQNEIITEEMLLQSITNEDGYLVTPNSQLLPYNCE